MGQVQTICLESSTSEHFLRPAKIGKNHPHSTNANKGRALRQASSDSNSAHLASYIKRSQFSLPQFRIDVGSLSQRKSRVMPVPTRADLAPGTGLQI